MHQQITLRRSDRGDAPAIGRLLHDFNTEYGEVTPGQAALSARITQLIDGGDTAVVLAGDGPDGLAVLRFREGIWTNAKECYLAELYVVPALRGRGIGRALLFAAMSLARSEGADHMDLGTSEADAAARRLYEGMGFTNRDTDGSVMFVYERELVTLRPEAPAADAPGRS